MTGSSKTGKGFVVGYIAASDALQLVGFSNEVLATETAARAEHSVAQALRPGWFIYQLTEISQKETK